VRSLRHPSRQSANQPCRRVAANDLDVVDIESKVITDSFRKKAYEEEYRDSLASTPSNAWCRSARPSTSRRSSTTTDLPALAKYAATRPLCPPPGTDVDVFAVHELNPYTSRRTGAQSYRRRRGIPRAHPANLTGWREFQPVEPELFAGIFIGNTWGKRREDSVGLSRLGEVDARHSFKGGA